MLIAELWTINNVFSHALRLGYRRAELETNNVKVARMATGKSRTLSNHALVIAIRLLLAFDWKIMICHICGTVNEVTNSLTWICHGTPIRGFHYDELSVEIVAAMLKDMSSIV
ncbi:hypothetical protein V6N11_029532 [Hibiscus sabdariffa]|uniref:RNase H type-1 domain-containing protein n=1 Tax=Hibiscus sabdariffa TaxID=183260 RepID=A0ABR2P7B7_9ROSI